jgi:putative membrane protein
VRRCLLTTARAPAYERTLLAWIRTGTSLITFGFTIYNFRRVISTPTDDNFEFAFVLVGIGLMALLPASPESRRDVRALRVQYPGMPPSCLPVTVALLVSALGLLALMIMLVRR